MQPVKINYKVYQGSTFEETFRWESQTKVYIPISTIDRSAPCVIHTQLQHNVPTGWRFRVVGAGGMKELNNVGDSYYLATQSTIDTIVINQVNSLGYTPYTQGGVIEYNQPVPITTYSARMQVRESVDSDVVLYECSSLTGEINIDSATNTIVITIPAAVTQTFQWSTAVYSVELYDNSGRVIPFLTGNLSLVQEVTR